MTRSCRAIPAAFQPLPDGADIVETRSLRATDPTSSAMQRMRPPRRTGPAPPQDTFLGQPIGMATRHVGQAEDVMEHDDAGQALACAWPGSLERWCGVEIVTSVMSHGFWVEVRQAS